MSTEHDIILFDGVCNLCNGAVQFIIKRDKANRYRFAALQSDLAKELTSQRNIDTQKIDSIILIEPGKAYYIKAPAALRMLLAIFEWIPPVISNWVYDLVARNRYRWFGRKDECMIPTPELKQRFLD